MTVAVNKLGTPKKLQAPGGTFDCTLVPVDMLQHLTVRQPVAATVGGTSNRTFTLVASAANPFVRWMDQYPVKIETSVAYSWVVGSNAILNSDGEQTTLTNSTTGVWYMYLYLSDTNVPTLIPSTTAPARTASPYSSGYYYHPGTLKDRPYVYVGFMLCNATTPTFLTAVKTGWVWRIPEQAYNVTTAWALVDTSAVVPATLGTRIAGTLKTPDASGGSIQIGPDSQTDTVLAAIKAVNAVDTVLAAHEQIVPFSWMSVTSAGKIYGKESTTGTVAKVNVGFIEDVA